MKNEINTLIEVIKADYLKFIGRGKDYADCETHTQKMIDDFNNGFEVKEGRAYTKIITRNSEWGFIVKSENDKRFQKGDILKAAGWAQPARNAARGNIFADAYSVAWTGPHYLI